jgi:hypothetical protein
MKRLNLFLVATVFALTFTSCDQGNVDETNALYENNTYGIDKKDVVPPGERD